MKRDWAVAAAIALACLLFGLSTLKPSNLRDYDQPTYLSVAHDLASTGVFTNGRSGPDDPGFYARNGGPGSPGAYTAPLYPAMVAALIPLSPALARAAACARDSPMEAMRACPPSLGLLLPVQAALAVFTLVLGWRTAVAVTGNKAVAWGALVAAGLGTTEYAVYARTAMTEALSLPLAALAGLLLVSLVQAPRWPTAAGLGVALGLLVLTRPDFLYLAGALGLVGLTAFGMSRRLGAALLGAVALAGVVVSPWSIRNERLFGSAGPTYGYSGFILAQRMAYEAMTPGEWVASWLYALPGFGPPAAHAVFPARDVDRLGWQERPDTFYMVGNGPAIDQMRADAPDPTDQVGYLVHRFVLPAPLHFAAVTMVMAWRGLWVRKYFSLVGVPFFFVMLVRAVRRRDLPMLAFVLPPVFLLFLHAATTVSTPRYSLILIPVYATAFASVVIPWASRSLQRFRFPNALLRRREKVG